MKSYTFILSLIATCSSMVSAQSDQIIFEKKVYKEVDGNKLHVDIFTLNSTQGKTNNPAIAFFHGGGWVFGDPSEFHGACKRYAAKGFVTFSFQYRLSINQDGSFPPSDITIIESVEDARSAIRWLRENANFLNIDPKKIVAGGQSAGEQLAWSTALFDTMNESTDYLNINTKPNALILYSSTYNTLEAWVDMILDEKREQIWSISPYNNLKTGLPPALVFHGQEDCTVLLYSVQFFADKLRKLDNPFELITLE